MTTSVEAENQNGKFVQANGLEIYYEERGQGAPLILLHGGMLTGASWEPYLAAFSEHYRVIMPDTRGHGRTNNPTGEMSYRTLADDVAAFVAALGLQKPLIFGFSDGGQTTLEIGMRYSDLPQALIIAGAYSELTEQSRLMIQNLLGDTSSPEVDTEQFEKNNPEWTVILKQEHGADKWRTLVNQVKPMWNATLGYTAEDFARVVAPTLVMLGDRDGLVPVEDAFKMFELLPNAELAIIPNAEHIDFFLSPPKIALLQPIIVDFLARHNS
jgi:pimeloyl-ACP methyl ester carboxylesterase